jgi:large subunit ribosomal protein L30
MEKIAVIRVAGQIHVNRRTKKALGSLRLYKKNFCVVIEKNKNSLGLMKKLKDYVTWGEIDEKTYSTLIEKRGKPYKGRDKKGKYLLVNKKKIKPFFRLSPPRKGYGRKGTKKSFKERGALGYRGEKINDLLRRMV